MVAAAPKATAKAAAKSHAKSAARTNAKRVPTRERQRLATRELLLGAAIEEIEREGLMAAQVGRIAEHAGVTRPTLYAHFPRKEDFLLALAERSRESMGRRIEEQVASCRGLDVVHKMIDVLFEAAENDYPVLRREIFSLFIREPQMLDWASDPFYGFLVERLEAARDRGDAMPGKSTTELIRIITNAIFGFMILENEPAEVRRGAAHDAIGMMLRIDT